MPAMVPGQEDAAADLHARLAGRPGWGSASSLRRCRRVTARPAAEVTVEQDSARVMETYLAASKNTLADRMGITILEASAERVVGTMPVAGNIQPYGLL